MMSIRERSRVSNTTCTQATPDVRKVAESVFTSTEALCCIEQRIHPKGSWAHHQLNSKENGDANLQFCGIIQVLCGWLEALNVLQYEYLRTHGVGCMSAMGFQACTLLYSKGTHSFTQLEP